MVTGSPLPQYPKVVTLTHKLQPTDIDTHAHSRRVAGAATNEKSQGIRRLGGGCDEVYTNNMPHRQQRAVGSEGGMRGAGGQTRQAGHSVQAAGHMADRRTDS